MTNSRNNIFFWHTCKPQNVSWIRHFGLGSWAVDTSSLTAGNTPEQEEHRCWIDLTEKYSMDLMKKKQKIPPGLQLPLYCLPVDLCLYSTPPGQKHKPTLLKRAVLYDFILLCEVRAESLELQSSESHFKKDI